MASKSSQFYVLGVAHKLCLAAEAVGFTPEELDILADNPQVLEVLLKVVRKKLRGAPGPVIDLGARPLVPRGLTLMKHDGEGVFAWDPRAVSLFQMEEQRRGSLVSGSRLFEEMKRTVAWNANVLDFLLGNQGLIPENWKERVHGCYPLIYFWGTLYRMADGSPCVRYLAWNGAKWVMGHSPVQSDWMSHTAAAVYRLVEVDI